MVLERRLDLLLFVDKVVGDDPFDRIVGNPADTAVEDMPEVA